MVKYLIALLILTASVGACEKDLVDWDTTYVDSYAHLKIVPFRGLHTPPAPNIATIRDLLEIDTTWGELDSAGCECHGMDFWYEIKRIDTTSPQVDTGPIGHDAISTTELATWGDSPSPSHDITWHPKVLKRQCCCEMRRQLEVEMDSILQEIRDGAR